MAHVCTYFGRKAGKKSIDLNVFTKKKYNFHLVKCRYTLQKQKTKMFLKSEK